jgi:tRNA A37 threonylcarbamoyladenosine dehydratase
MQTDWLERTALLVGADSIEKLNKAHVLIVGMGGVGSYAAEMICRAGVGKMTIVDGDVVDRTNRNRQLPATFQTEGKSKVYWMKERLLEINPELDITAINEFLIPEKIELLLQDNQFDYVMDCIDSITPKLTLIELAYRNKIKIVSSMGAGGKVDPTRLKVADISKTIQCKLASRIRKSLKQKGIKKGIKAVFSDEDVIKESLKLTDGKNFKKSFYGTISYLPCVFGCTAASVVIRDLIDQEN